MPGAGQVAVGNLIALMSDHMGMRCDLAREALSTRLDGELGQLEDAALDHHLDTCAGCQQHARALAALHRSLRVREAEPVPDLTTRIMTMTADQLPSPNRRRSAAGGPVEWARYALFTVAFTQLVMALPMLAGEHSGIALHHMRELGSFSIALAVGLLVVAWQPQRASGLLPMATVLVAGLALTAAADIVSGRSSGFGESPHLLEVVGVVLLWHLARTNPTQPSRSVRAA
jgi:predicted anti-sigma-YlaC factor YlaD